MTGATMLGRGETREERTEQLFEGRLSDSVRRLWLRYYPVSRHARFKELLLRNVRPTDRVLEIGAGSGTANQNHFDLRGRVARYVGVDPDESVLPRAPIVREVVADRAGFVGSLGATAIGMAALRLGAGRGSKDDAIDHAVGIRCLRKRGDAVVDGEPLAEVHARDERGADRAIGEVRAAYTLADEAPQSRRIVLDVVTP